MKFASLTKHNDELSNDVRNRLHSILMKNGHIEDEISPNYVFVIGGDGSFLRAVEKYNSQLDKVIFVGFKTGKVGFYNSFNIGEDVENIIDIISKENLVNSLCTLQIDFNNKTYIALNEITISNPPSAQSYKVYIDDNMFENYYGNGLLVCTTTGSTAYNKSLNGAILDSKLKGFELTEIAPINSVYYHSIRGSIVLSDDRKVRIESKLPQKAMITIDTKQINISDFTRLDVKISNIVVRCLAKEEDDFFDRVKKSFPI